MLLRRLIVAGAGLLPLSGCDDGGLHLNVHYRDADGLSAGAPVVKDATVIGSVESIQADRAGGYLVGIEIDDKFAAAATRGSRFLLVDQPKNPGRKQVEVEQREPGDAVLAEGSTIEGAEPAAGFPAFGELFQQFGEGLKGLRGQLEQFQEELRRAPESPEARQLQEDWRRLTEEIQRAQSQAEESVNKDLLPKLRQEMERLNERFRDFRAKPVPPKKDPNVI